MFYRVFLSPNFWESLAPPVHSHGRRAQSTVIEIRKVILERPIMHRVVVISRDQIRDHSSSVRASEVGKAGLGVLNSGSWSNGVFSLADIAS